MFLPLPSRWAAEASFRSQPTVSTHSCNAWRFLAMTYGAVRCHLSCHPGPGPAKFYENKSGPSLVFNSLAHVFDPVVATLNSQTEKTALYLRSVCWIKTAFHGLRCHPLACIVLKLRLSVDSNPIAPTNKIHPSAVRSQLGHLSRILDWFKPEFDLSFSEGKRECEILLRLFLSGG